MENMDLEQRSYIRLRLLDSISELSNLSEQELLWLNPDNENPHYTWIEYSQCFFDWTANVKDCAEMVEAGILVAPEASCIQPLNKALIEYRPPNKDAYDLKAILQDEGWKNIVKIALHTKLALLQILRDSSEIDHLQT